MALFLLPGTQVVVIDRRAQRHGQRGEVEKVAGWDEVCVRFDDDRFIKYSAHELAPVPRADRIRDAVKGS